MRLAEITATRSLIALSSLATLGLAGAVIATCPCPSSRAPVVTAAPVASVTPLRGCGVRVTVRPKHHAMHGHPAPEHPRHGNAFREVLQRATPTLEHCLPAGTEEPLRLTLRISADGEVRDAELTQHGARVADDDVQTCVLAVASALTFPRAPHEVTLTTHLVNPAP